MLLNLFEDNMKININLVCSSVLIRGTKNLISICEINLTTSRPEVSAFEKKRGTYRSNN